MTTFHPLAHCDSLIHSLILTHSLTHSLTLPLTHATLSLSPSAADGWCRQGPTWSSIEYGGKWKALHYMLRRVYSPVLLSGYRDYATDMVHIYLTRYASGSMSRRQDNQIEL